jgi:hypothetical protein
MWKVVLAAALLGFVGATAAGISPVFSAKIEKVLVDKTNFGGCMAKLSVSPKDQSNVTCKDSWVSFGCTGEFWPKDVAARMLSMAQLALVTRIETELAVSDTEKYNGYCTVTRIGVNL